MAEIKGTSLSETLTGTSDADTISGFASNDVVQGGSGDDFLFGDFGGTTPGVDGTPLTLSSANQVSSTYTGGSFAAIGDSIVYENVTTLDDGTVVSARLVYVANTDTNMPVVIDGNNGAEILLNSGSGNSSSYENDYATFRLEFFDPATGNPVSVNAMATFNDIDGNSSTDTEDVRISGESFTSYGVTNTSAVNIATSGNSVTASGTQANSPKDQASWFSATFENQTYIEFDLSPRTTQSGFSMNGSAIDNPDVSAVPQGDDEVFGEDGNDTIYGGGGNDTLFGGADNDMLSGDDGTDTLFGGAGDDELILGRSDSAAGGDGDDRFTVDTALAGSGDLTITGGEGAETLGDTLDLSDLYAGGLIQSGSLTFDSPDRESGSVTLTDGAVITFSEIENFICFTKGTLILTESGAAPIEELSVGDRVATRDHGLQSVAWIGSRTLPAQGAMAPIMIKAGALGNSRDLTVSPQHRMLITGWKAELLFGEEEVLVAAKHLVNNDTIYVAQGETVTYFHILFEQHELVSANGAWSESFHPGEEGFDALSEDAREEVLAIFPELRDQPTAYGKAARASITGQEAALL